MGRAPQLGLRSSEVEGSWGLTGGEGVEVGRLSEEQHFPGSVWSGSEKVSPTAAWESLGA